MAYKRSDYCTLAQLRSYLKVSSTDDNALLSDMIQRASRVIDRLTRRWFYELSDTREFDYQGQLDLGLDADLLALTTLTIDGTATTDYKLGPRNYWPKQWVEILLGSGSSFQWSDTPQDAISVAGLWGYHEAYPDAWLASGDTVQNDPLSAAGVTLAVTSGAAFSVGQTIKAGSEQMHVTAISSNNLTVTRGLNGTTAAEQAAGVALSIWQPQADIQHLCIRLAGWFYRQKDAPYSKTADMAMGTIIEPVDLPPDIARAVLAYERTEL